MATQVVKLTGFREVERALREIPKATGKNVLRRVAKGALEPLADSASAKAPRDEGRLAFSISVGEKRTRRVRTGFQRLTGIEMAMGPGNTLPGVLQYASFVEFGTVDTPPQPYMRPAWNSGADRTLEYIKDNLWREIDKAAAKVAVKRAKAGL